MHTKDFLAQELEHAGLPELAERGRQGLYHDFLSPLDFPDADLAKAGQSGGGVVDAAPQREFDASKEESEE